LKYLKFLKLIFFIILNYLIQTHSKVFIIRRRWILIVEGYVILYINGVDLFKIRSYLSRCANWCFCCTNNNCRHIHMMQTLDIWSCEKVHMSIFITIRNEFNKPRYISWIINSVGEGIWNSILPNKLYI